MFHKLKLQFIMTNLTIITFLFVTLIIGVYISFHIQMINHAEFFAKRLAMCIQSGEIPGFLEQNGGPPRNLPDRPPFLGKRPSGPSPFLKGFHGDFRFGPHPPSEPPGPPHGHGKPSPIILFIKVNAQGGIITESSTRPLDRSEKKRLFQEANRSKNNKAIIQGAQSSYYFYRASLLKEHGSLMVFLDLQHELGMEHTLILSLLIIGLVYLSLSLAGSVFMAKRAISPIQKAWQQQKDFLADASHELRTPLTVIQTNLEAVLSSPEETVHTQMEWLENIQEELGHTTELVASLLFLARIDSQQYRMSPVVFSLDQLMVRVCETFKALAEKKQIQIGCNVEHISYCGDESNIRRTVEILLDNAIRHTPTGGRIDIHLRQSEKKLFLSIADTGEGIPAEHLPKIFDRFYQVDSARSKGKAGLGLSIAKGIVASHGGTIQVVSQFGQGTTFTIQLPLAKAADCPPFKMRETL